MAIAITLLEYLEWKGVDYDILKHPHTYGSLQTAEMAHVPGDQVAKCVVLEDDKGYLMAVLPATHHLELGKLHWQLDRHLGLATEKELGDLFGDCETGAIPPVGEAYGFDVIVDDSLMDSNDIYFEAGDHRELIHVSGFDFMNLLPGAEHGSFSRHI